MNKKSCFFKIIAVSFGILVSIILIVGCEFILKFFNVNAAKFDVEYPPSYYDFHDFGVKRPSVGKHQLIARRLPSKETIWDEYYDIDQYHHRITPRIDSGEESKFLAFLGCSFTYGEGVAGDETLPYYVGRLTKKYRPYNYGFHGLGPFDVLAVTEHTNFKEQIKEDNGLFVYTYIDGHLHRVAGSMRIMSWKRTEPFYRLIDGKLVRAGSFETGRPLLTKLYRFLAKSEILQTLKINFPLRFQRKHFELTALSLKNIETNIKKVYPDSRFLVLIYPSSLYPESLITELKKLNIDYLDYSKLFNRNTHPYAISVEDQHPSPFAYSVVAKKLAEDLNLQ